MRIPLIPNTVKLLVILMAILIFAMSYTGHVRTSMLPFPKLDIEKSYLMLGWRLSGLTYDRAACTAALNHPSTQSRPIKDNPIKNGCGYVNAVRLTKIGGVSSSSVRVSCPMGVALAMWMKQIVQPAAQKHLGTKVSRMKHLGTYACRNIKGSIFSKYLNRRSEHATANAIDISAFTLKNGGTVNILRDWTKGNAKSAFLKEIHYGACGYFRVVLGPEANYLHANHFHFDRGMLIRCK
jgi:hypothetical protein